MGLHEAKKPYVWQTTLSFRQISRLENGKKIFTNFVSARGLISKIQKEPNKLNGKKTYDQPHGVQNSAESSQKMKHR